MSTFIKYRYVLLLCVTYILIPSEGYTEPGSDSFWNQINWGAGIGYSGMKYTQSISNIYTYHIIIQNDGVLRIPVYESDTNEKDYVVNWFHNTYSLVPSNSYHKKPTQADIEPIRFKGTGHVVPFFITAHRDIENIFRLGLGCMCSISQCPVLVAFATEKDYEEYAEQESPPITEAREELDNKLKEIHDYIPRSQVFFCFRPFIQTGLKIAEWRNYSAWIDFNFGLDILYTKAGGCVPILVYGDGVSKIGIRADYAMSDYANVFVSCSWDSATEREYLENATTVTQKKEGIVIELGFYARKPNITRCMVANCCVKHNHRHLDRIYRGVSIFKRPPS